MNTLTLPRNVQFLYEEHLARLEFEALGCRELKRAGDHWDQMTGLVNGTADVMLSRSAYLGHLDGQASTYSQLITPGYQGGEFNRTRSVNQYLTHWIYPYRGKFHPQMVRALFNIIGIQPGQLALDLFLGSGTTALEAQLLGVNCVGIDSNPVCVLVSKVKTQAYAVAAEIHERVEELLTNTDLKPGDVDPRGHDDPRVNDFLQVALLVTASDVNRRDRNAGTALRKNLRTMAESVVKQARAIREFNIDAGAVRLELGDARDLARSNVEADSIDGIVTSPPYSIALDY